MKRGGKEFIDEYKAQLAQVVEQFGWEKKAVEAYQLAVNASQDYGVVNACSRDALQALKKAKPELAEGAVETLPKLAALAPPEVPSGYGLIDEIAPQAAVRPAAAGAAAPLPPLQERAPAQQPETSTTNDPQRRVPDADKPVPPRRKNAGDDEDLLP